MKLLFKSSNTGGNAVTVGSTNFKEHYAAINANTAWKTVLPSVKRATRDKLIPYISQELYDALADLYDGDEELSAEQEEFLSACQDVVAYFTIIGLSPELNVTIGDMGIVEKGSNQQPVMPVAQWRYKEFKYDLCKKADEYLDKVLELLEKYVIDEDDFFTPWVDSIAYTQNRTNFFNTAELFSKYVNINNSRRLFNQLAIDISRAEEKIDSIIGVEQFNELVEDIKVVETLDEPVAELLDKIRRYVSAKAMTTCIPRLFITLDGRGFSLSSYTDGYDASNHFSAATRGAEAVEGFIHQLQADAGVYHQDLINFIYANIDDLPLIKDSEAYEAYSTAHTGRIISSHTGGGVFL